MVFADFASTVSIIGAITGIVTGAIGTTIAVLSYRRQRGSAPVAPAPAGATHGRAEPAVIQTPGRRLSAKAGLSALVGILATFYASLLSAAASLGEAEDTITEGATFAVLLAVVALIVGFLARSDIKRDPGRRGRSLAMTGIITGGIACLVAFGSIQVGDTLPDGPIGGGSQTTTTPMIGQQITPAVVARTILPQFLNQYRQHVPSDVFVSVDSLVCGPVDPVVGTCDAAVSLSSGESGTVPLTYTIDSTTGIVHWKQSE